jgi:NSS family neurotransmitter:Na+ symporter
MFAILVVQSLFLPGASDGLNAFFTPNWEALADPGVWASAYGHIFFSLSVAFGIMVTYSSYLKRRTDLTGSGLVVAFANSGFEILAGIGVFAALGFMAQSQGTEVAGVATSGIGLAFIAFPTIVSQAAGGSLIGVLFFGALVFAGITSLVSILEVIVAALQDKLGWGRIRTTLIVSIPLGVISMALFSTTTALSVLDTMDAFVNAFGIMAVALVAVIVLGWVLRSLPTLKEHLNRRSSFRVGRLWMLLVGLLAPLVLGYLFVTGLISKLAEPYSGYPAWFLGVFGWGMVIALVVVAVLLTLIPWSPRSHAKDDPEYDEFLSEEHYEADAETASIPIVGSDLKGGAA